MENVQNFGLDPINSPIGSPFNLNSKINKINTPKDQFNEPSNLTWRQLVGKVFIGIIVWGIISALLFIVLSFIWGMFTSALSGQAGTSFGQTNPMLGLILLFIGFLSSFIGNISIAGVYNLFFSKKYYDGAKIFGLLLLTNAVLFFILAPMYLVFSSQVQTLFIVLWFHIIFSIFISACQIEFSANPNYSGSALMGNVIGFAASFLVYSIIYKSSSTGGVVETQTYLLMLLPSILGYSLIPFGSGIREKIYYKIYEMGSNPFYILSPSEVMETTGSDKTQQDLQDINIEG